VARFASEYPARFRRNSHTVVTKRKISGGTVSEVGKTARDTILGLLKTCRKLGVSYYRFLGDRLGVPRAIHVAPLPDLVRLAKA